LLISFSAVGQSQVATVTPIGPGCGGLVPTMTVTPPEIGGSVALDLTGATPHGMVWLGYGPQGSPPYPTFAGCPVYLDVASATVLFLGVTSDLGDLQVSFPVPLQESLLGASVAIQFFIWDMSGLYADSFSDSVLLTVGLPPPTCELASSIGSNFNGTAIGAGRTVWFNAIIDATGIPASGGIIHLQASSIDFTAGATPFHVDVPPALIVYDPAAVSAETHFDVGTGEWRTTVPVGYAGNVFLSGVGLDAGSGLPGGINPVTWNATVSTSVPGLGFHWKWAAAVYTTFTSDPNAIGVKPVDSNTLSIYANSDHAGTPEAFKASVVGGARGGGGSNFTGSYSGTGSATCQ
jgi:hypothetical protein